MKTPDDNKELEDFLRRYLAPAQSPHNTILARYLPRKWPQSVVAITRQTGRKEECPCWQSRASRPLG